MSLKRLLVVITLVVATFGPVNSAAAQKKKRRVIRLEEAVIEGRIAKPTAFFISTSAAFFYELMTIDESFVSEITKAVDHGPF